MVHMGQRRALFAYIRMDARARPRATYTGMRFGLSHCPKSRNSLWRNGIYGTIREKFGVSRDTLKCHRHPKRKRIESKNRKEHENGTR